MHLTKQTLHSSRNMKYDLKHRVYDLIFVCHFLSVVIACNNSSTTQNAFVTEFCSVVSPPNIRKITLSIRIMMTLCEIIHLRNPKKQTINDQSLVRTINPVYAFFVMRKQHDWLARQTGHNSGGQFRGLSCKSAILLVA